IQSSSHRSISSAHSWARQRFLHWADQRRAHRSGHPVEADDALAGTERREGFGNPAETASKFWQLLPTHTFPAGSMAISTCDSSPPPTYPPGGEMGSPIFMPDGFASGRQPASSTMPTVGFAKFETQT